MNRQDCLQIGTIVKTHGIHGELVLELKNPDLQENIKESILLDIEGLLVPFFIQTSEPTSSTRLRIKLDWTTTEKQAKRLCNCPVYIELNESTLPEENLLKTPELIEGFQIQDINHGHLGVVSRIINNNNSLLLEVNNEGRNLLIPLHDDFIVEVNTDKKSITLETPDGLIELYQ